MFKLGTGDLDELCFNMENGIEPYTLNRLGAIRLLDTIDKQCPGFQLYCNWKNVKRMAATFSNIKQNKVMQLKQKNNNQHPQSHQVNTSHSTLSLTTTHTVALHLLYVQVSPPHHYSYSGRNLIHRRQS